MPDRTPHPFLGDLVPYPDVAESAASGELAWGGGALVSPKRVSRPRPRASQDCPFCRYARGEANTSVTQRFRIGESAFVSMQNEFPIVRDHMLIFPVEHRLEPAMDDFRLLLDLVGDSTRQGSESGAGAVHLPNAPVAPAKAVYLNTRGAGQTIEHLHLHAVPSAGLPLPALTRGDPVVAVGGGRALLTRCTGLPFYVLAIVSANHHDAATAMGVLHERLQTWGVAYNLLAFPGRRQAPAAADGLTLLVVPRAREYCPAALTSVAGFELLSGVLVPDVLPEHPLTVADRDLAFQQATLDTAQAADLERRLKAAGEFRSLAV